MSISGSWEIQRSLSKLQAIPVIGSTLVSPVKAVVSLAETVAGIAGAIIFGTLAVVTSSPYCAEKCIKSVAHIGLGLLGFMYSVSNFISLGIVGYTVENLGQPRHLHVSRMSLL